jgi:signal transduction histidine kinase/CheY-like chemotaxis protein
MVSFSSYGLLIVMLYFFWGLVPNPTLYIWGSITFSVATWLLISISLFKRYGNESNTEFWYKISAASAVVHDVPLGFIGPLGFMVDNELYQIFVVFMLGGMCAGAITTRGVIFKIYVASMIALLTPIIIVLALHKTDVANGMLALTIMYFLFMLSVARNYSSTMTNNFLLWLDNEKLVGQLTQSHTEVEEANRVLTREIEHRRKVEGELVKARDRSERASEAKNQFLANVSHELRTPLNGIMGFADLLQQEQLDEIQKRYANQIGKSAETLLRIVNDILDITAIEAGHLAFYEDTFSLRAELDNVFSILRPRAESKSLELTLKIDDDVEDNLYGEANRLRQVISNLITNAVKYTDKGHISVHVSRHGMKDDQVRLNFAVEDTGTGIPDEALSTIFDNFTRVEGFETRTNEGVGLGLAIVKTLVQRMGGTLNVQSSVGVGSCFSCEIPFVISVKTAKVEEEVETPSLTPAQWQALQVLVVDDNDVNRMVLAAFLSKAGIPFTEADSGSAALERIREGGVDLVLLDIQMPGMSGFDVVQRLHEEQVKLPVLIAVTAHAFPEQRQAILDAGFVDFLIKPVSEPALLKTLTRVYMGGYDEVPGKVNAAAE